MNEVRAVPSIKLLGIAYSVPSPVTRTPLEMLQRGNREASLNVHVSVCPAVDHFLSAALSGRLYALISGHACR